MLIRTSRISDCRVVDIDPVDIGAGRHHATHRPVAQTHHAGDHLAFIRLDHAGRFCLGHDGLDFLLGHSAVGLCRLADETEDQLGRGIEQPDNGSTDPGDQRHQGRHRTGDPFRAFERQVFGHELAHHYGEIGDGPDHKAVAERLGRALRHALGEQDLREALAERRTGEGAGQDADKGDADLNRRQEPSGILGQFEGGGSARASVVGHRLQAGLASRDNGQFGQCEEAVQANQKDGNSEFKHN